jgi:tRNA A-37 threonylcarbamoyl transferase component Bud32
MRVQATPPAYQSARARLGTSDTASHSTDRLSRLDSSPPQVTIIRMANVVRGVGRYELVREIGHGGTATVYLARQTDLSRLVALKELSALSADDPSAARRFVRESRLAGSLNDPNIVTVHDFFEDHGTPFIAMEYLERGSLRPLMRDLTFVQIAGVLEALLAGLAHAQERGIVHRDLKPENLLVTTDGRVKIADFGIAKATNEAQNATMLTVKGTVIGTPTYMAPEQAMAGDIGSWTDLYAVGVIAFELLAGRPPFDTTGTPTAILLQHVNTPPLELSSLVPSVDPRLSDWIDRLLTKEPADRPHLASAAWLRLEEIVLAQLGPRWRRSARLTAAPAAELTPATLPMARRDETDERMIPTAMPRRAAAAGAAGAVAAAAAAAARPARPRDGRSARRLARSALLVMALVVAVTAAFALGSGNGSSGGSNAVPTAPAAAPTGAAPTSAAPTSAAPAGAAATAAPTAAPPTNPSGVGDSQSDDPSDDEEEVGEP